MENSIQFKHFRKFEDFPKLDFNDITFVVGKNNSGKSTFVKAFVMVYNYLNSKKLDVLDLNQGSVELLNIVTFDRALCKTMPHRESKYHIPITVKIGNYEFFLDVTGKKDSTILDVTTFKIIDHDSSFSLVIHPQNNHAVISYYYKEVKENDDLKNALQEKVEIENTLLKVSDTLSKERVELNMRLEKVTKIIENLKGAKTEIETSFMVEEFYSATDFDELLEDVYTKLEAKFWIQNPNVEFVEDNENNLENELEVNDQIDDDLSQSSDLPEQEEEIEFDDLRYYYINRAKFHKFFKQFISFVEASQIFYLPATLNKQSALLSIRDKNNDLADVVHKYYQLDLQNNTMISSFVSHWINEFQIGTDIEIELVRGESYEINLKENGVFIPLADKGMGSIQAVLLILRLASVIHFKEQQKKKSKFDYFVVVEEPELNLHPALQSKLCDLFFEVYEKLGVKFIIETHSEYVIRKSQLIVKGKDLEIAPNENPFSVIYFNDDLRIWNMIYREDGRFSNEFGSGFFDESSNLAFELM